MDLPVTNSTRSSADISTDINEMLSEKDNILSLPSAKKKRNKKATFKSANPHNGFPSGSNSSKHQSGTPQQDARKAYGNHPDLHKHFPASMFSHVKSKLTHSHKESSTADKRLKEIIQSLTENPLKNQDFVEKKKPANDCSERVRKSRKFLAHMMEQPKFHYIIIVLIMLDLVIVFVELIMGQLSLACLTDAEMEQYNTTKQRDNCLLPPTNKVETAETALFFVSLVLISIFVLEIFTAFYAFGWRRYTKILFLFDAFIVISSFILEVYFRFGNLGKVGSASAGVVVLRMWKIIRAIHAVAHAVTLRNHLIIEEIEHARQIVNEEKLRAEKTIEEQQKKINSLTELLEKSVKQGRLQQQNSVSVRKRANSMDSIMRF